MPSIEEKNRPVRYKYRDSEADTYLDDEWAKRFFDNRRRDDLIKYIVRSCFSGAFLLVVLWMKLDLSMLSMSMFPYLPDIIKKISQLWRRQ